VSDPTVLEKAWQEFVTRNGAPIHESGKPYEVFCNSRDAFAAGFAAGATASDTRKLILSLDPETLAQLKALGD
jgi:hypothetical protein